MQAFLECELAAGGPYLLGERFTSAGVHYRRVGERLAAQRVREQEGLADST